MTIWFVWWRTGEYSDRSESPVEPFHATREGALEHMARLAAEQGYWPDPSVEWKPGEPVTDFVQGDAPARKGEKYFDADSKGRMTLNSAEVVVP